MPIRGMTDRAAAFPEIGRVRKGAPKRENAPGEDLSYFRVEFDEEETEIQELFLAHYGTTPRDLDVLLPFEKVEENFDTWREAYLAGGLVHRCDGERVEYQIEPESGEKLVLEGDPMMTHDPREPIVWYNEKPLYCRPTGRLKVIIPILKRLAFLTVLTGSIHDIINLSNQLGALQIFQGSLTGIPLILRRRPVMISTPGEGGKRVRREKWLLSIEANPEWVGRKLIQTQDETLSQLPGAVDGKLLEIHEEVPVEDEMDREEIVEQEPEEEGGLLAEFIAAEDWQSAFWHVVHNESVLDTEGAQSILGEHDGDYRSALKIVREQHIPPA